MSLEASTSRLTLDDEFLDTDADAQDRSLLVLYGSQTGTAQDTAERIARAIRRLHIRARVMAMDDCDQADLLDESLIIFVCATTGQGDEPANMRQFWQFLRRGDLPADLLDGLLFSVFGLGDSTYPKFNWVAKKLHRRLAQLGAQACHQRGEADEQDYLGIDTTLTSWLDGLLVRLLELFPLPPGVQIIPESERPPSRLRILAATSISMANGHAKAPARTQMATLKRSTRATALEHFQDTRYITLELDDPARWDPSDVIELRPENAPDDVQAFLETLDWQSRADEELCIASSSEDQPLPRHWPHRVTLRQLLTQHLDIFSVPRRSFFEFLSYFTTEDVETEKLREFCSAEGQEDMYDYANRPRRTIAEVMQEFRSARIPLEYIADIFPEMRPRQFSIASSSKTDNRQVDLLVAVVKYRTKLRKPRQGVCTAWLSRLEEGTRLSVSFARGSMLLPQNVVTPIIAIGPGTGIAPFRAFVQERALQQAHRNLVFFGCRSRSKDFYYENEWEERIKRQQASLFVAASRDQDHKIYVQDQIRENAGQVWAALEAGAVVYISGAADKMPKAVREALLDVVRQQGSMTEKEAGDYVEQMDATRRLQEETWS